MTWSHIIGHAVFVVALAAGASAADVVSETDISYGSHYLQASDRCRPADMTDGAGVIVFFHGGGFTGGDKASLMEIALDLCDAGHVVVTPNYRLAPRAAFPVFVEDGARATVQARDAFRRADGQARPVVLAGWSAGAYIAGLLATDQRYLAAQGLPEGAVAGFIGLAGPYRGGLCEGRTCPTVFPHSTRADWPVAGFVDPGDPPMLLIRGGGDAYVDAYHLDELAEAGRAAGVPVSVLVDDYRGHVPLLRQVGRAESEVRAAIDTFLKGVFEP